MTPKQDQALRHLHEVGRKWLSAAELGVRPSDMAPLVRKGLVVSRTQTVNPIHERKYSFKLYTLPLAGWSL